MATQIKLKRGTSTPTTSNLASGEVAIDTNAQKFYINDSGTIKEIGGGSSGIEAAALGGDVRSYTGNGTLTDYTVSNGADVENVLVFINGVYQRPTTDYTVSSTTLTFGTAPANGDAITIKELVEGLNSISFTDDTSTVTTITAGETLKIAGGSNVTTSISGDTLTINSSASGDLTIADDSSTTTTLDLANDTLKVAGGTNITTSLSGDTLTINGPDLTSYVTLTDTQTLSNKTLDAPTFTGNTTFDTGTLYVDSSNNRVGIGTTSPAYQFEIENTGANALLVLDRTDGAACFIEGQANRSAFGSVGATPLALAYNSAAVVTIGASGAITVNPDGANPFTFPTSDGSANQVLQTDGSGNLSFASVSSGGNAFSTINLNDSTNVVADSSTDTLNLDSSGLISITGDASTDTITVGTVSSATIPFLKADGSSSNIDLQTSGTIGDVISNLHIPFTLANGTGVTTLVVA